MYKAYLDFSGGRNDTFSDLRLAQNEGPIFRNVNLDIDGAVSKRKGSQKLIATPIGASHEVGGMVYFKPSGGSAELVVAAGTKIVRYIGSWDVLYSTLTNNLLMQLVPFKNLLYFNNGTDVPLVYAQSLGAPKVFRPGEPAPASAATFNANIAGAMLAGQILVRVRYVSPIDDSFVGEPTPELGTLLTVTASGGLRINIPVYAGSDHRVAKRLIERTKVGGGIFYIDGYVANNSTTTYDIVQSDAALEGNFEAPDIGSRNVPPKLFPFCLAGNRIVGWNAVNRRVEWSNIDQFGVLPEAFHEDDYHYLDITDAEDEPVACVRFGDSVVFYTGRSTHRLYIDDGGQSQAFRLDTWEIGVPGPRCALEVPGGHLVWTFKGPFLFDGNELHPIGERIRTFNENLEAPKMRDAYVVHRYDRRQVKFVVPSLGAAHSDSAALFHYQVSRGGMGVNGVAWTTHDGFEAKSGCIGRDASTKRDLEFSGDYSGIVRIEDVTDSEDFTGGPITAEFVTRWLDCDDPYAVKEFSDIWVVLQSELAGNITVSWESEFGAGVSGTDVLSSAEASAVFDTAVFDVSRFAVGSNKVIHAWTAQDGVALMGRHVRFRFGNTNAGEPFTILGFLLQYKPVRDRSDGV